MLSSVNGFQFFANDPDDLNERISRGLGWPVRLWTNSAAEFKGSVAIHSGRRLISVTGHYSTDFIAQAQEAAHNLIILLTTEGHTSLGDGDQRARWDNTKIMFGKAALKDSLHFLGQTRSTYFTLPFEALLGYSYRLYGSETAIPFDVFCVLDIDTRQGAFYRSLLLALESYLAVYDGQLHSEFTLHSLEDALLSSTLDFFRTLLGDPLMDMPVMPPVMKAALDLIRSAERPLLVSELAERLDVTVRSLQLGFLDAFGTSPHAHIKNMRLSKLRFELAARGPDCFHEAARYWGFTNVTRLKRDFIQTFGAEDWQKMTLGAAIMDSLPLWKSQRYAEPAGDIG